MISTKLMVFAFLIWFATWLMISSVNPVYAVLFLISIFINSAILLIFLKTDYLGLVFIIVYVGAITILFLFVVMVLNIKKLQQQNYSYLTLASLITVTLASELIIYAYSNDYYINFNNIPLIQYKDWSLLYQIQKGCATYNFAQLGFLMFTEFGILVVIASVILLMSILGAISVTNFRNKINYIDLKQQNYYEQNTAFTSVYYTQ
jgi:NADH:ubiquinone oxidoreductase subunit 6 (subunit J)